MRRYNFLSQSDIFEALNLVKGALLAAQTIEDVEEIMNGLMTKDEQIKIGRRILIASMIKQYVPYRTICTELNVGMPTVIKVANNLDTYSRWFSLISRKNYQIKDRIAQPQFRTTGGSTKIFKSRVSIPRKKIPIR